MSYFQCPVCGVYKGMINSMWHPCACETAQRVKDVVKEIKPSKPTYEELESQVLDLQAWKDSALTQFGKQDALRESFKDSPEYLGWDIYEAAGHLIERLRTEVRDLTVARDIYKFADETHSKQLQEHIDLLQQGSEDETALYEAASAFFARPEWDGVDPHVIGVAFFLAAGDVVKAIYDKQKVTPTPKPQMRPWISLKDEQPAEEQWVWVVIDSVVQKTPVQLRNGWWEWAEPGATEAPLDAVSYWKPLNIPGFFQAMQIPLPTTQATEDIPHGDGYGGS